MLHSIKKLIGDKGRQLIVPIVLMSLDAIGSLVMYLMLYFTVVHLLSGTLSGTLVRNYTIVCLISVILRLIIYRSGYFLCFSRGAKMCSNLRLQLANHYRSLSLGYFNQNSSCLLYTSIPCTSSDRQQETYVWKKKERTMIFMARSTKSYEERMLQLEKKEQESLEKAKQYAAQKRELKKRQKDVETKKRTHRLCQIGGAVESVLGSDVYKRQR